MPPQKNTELRVGLFVLAAIVVATVIAFAVGSNRSLFTPKVRYFTRFTNVEGLRGGSPVRISGVNVGSVASVRLLDGGETEVVLEIAKEAQRLVRTDSVAFIGSKGMLGDKLIEVLPGKKTRLPPNNPKLLLPTRDSVTIVGLMHKAGGALDNARAMTERLRKATESLVTPDFATDLQATVHNVAKVTAMAAEGRGTVQRLLTDPKMAQSVGRTVSHVETLSASLVQTLGGVHAIINEVRRGDGSAHALIYGQEGKRLVRSLADATGEVALLLKDVRVGDGALHDLIYENKANAFLRNLTTVSADLKAITGAVRRGEGTVGRLLTDPSLYEDVKRLVGDLERNTILKALVRYSIKRDEEKPAANVEAKTKP
ncbi:MAG: MlaD family protein [Polyangiales bacterium]